MNWGWEPIETIPKPTDPKTNGAYLKIKHRTGHVWDCQWKGQFQCFEIKDPDTKQVRLQRNFKVFTDWRYVA